MSDDERALLRAICEQPDDDNVRMIAADWYEDNDGSMQCPDCEKKPDEVNHPPGMMFVGWGHGWQLCSRCHGSATVPNGYRERAKFIRLQIELANTPCAWLQCNGPICDVWVTNGEKDRCSKCNTADSLRQRERDLWGAWPDTNDMRTYFHTQIAGNGPPTEWVILPSSMKGGGDGSRSMYVHRGFVSELSCTINEFMDSECGCDDGVIGSGGTTPWGEPVNERCPNCDGTGTLPGLARTLFGEHPVTKVVITDKEPERWPSENYLWHLDGSGEPDDLPFEIFTLLTATSFYNSASALAALSRACVNYARSLHGLTPLTKEQVGQ